MRCHWNSKTDWGKEGSTCLDDAECNVELVCERYQKWEGVCQKVRPTHTLGGPAAAAR